MPIDLTTSTQAQSKRACVVYCRLSREELNEDKEPTPVKLERRKAICLGLAAQYGLTVIPENIILETESGTRIARAGLQDVLKRARAGEIGYLITPSQDRLLRGNKRDLQDMEDAFVIGSVIMISTEGVIDFGNENYDTTHSLLVTVKAAVAQQYVLDVIKKRRDSDKVKIKEGIRTRGTAAYGYVWRPAKYERRELVQAGRYETVPEEYAVVCELFRRIRTESLASIARDFQRRYETTGKPAPSGVSRFGHGRAWYVQSLHAILCNPIYAGYPSQQRRIIRGKKVNLQRSEWLMPESEQAYPHPVSLLEQQEIIDLMRQRKRGCAARTTQNYLLTGILHCADGYAMHRSGANYTCACRAQHRPQHSGADVSVRKAEGAALRVIQESLAAIPGEILTRPKAGVDRTAIRRDYDAAQTRLRAAEEEARELGAHGSLIIKHYGAGHYEQSLARNAAEITEAKRVAEELRARLLEPEPEAVRPVLMALRAVGFQAFWEEASAAERRALALVIIRRMTVIPSAKAHGHIRGFHVDMHAWIGAYYQPATLVKP